MQWLIDLVAEKVIAEIGIPPVYIDRGDPVDFDWNHTTLILDNNWHTLDLSGIVDPNAKAVLIRGFMESSVALRTIIFRRHGITNEPLQSIMSTQVANLPNYLQKVVALSTDLKIEYKARTGPWNFFFLVISGWWS